MTLKQIFEILSKVNVSSFLEKKKEFNYLSWSDAWHLLISNLPDCKINYIVHATQCERSDEVGNTMKFPMPYFTDGRTAWVETSLNIDDNVLNDILPIMSEAVKPIWENGQKVKDGIPMRSKPIAEVTSMDVNKTIQRSLVRCIAKYGLGLYVYQGEDLPIDDETPSDKSKANQKALLVYDEAVAALKAMMANNAFDIETAKKIVAILRENKHQFTAEETLFLQGGVKEKVHEEIKSAVETTKPVAKQPKMQPPKPKDIGEAINQFDEL